MSGPSGSIPPQTIGLMGKTGTTFPPNFETAKKAGRGESPEALHTVDMNAWDGQSYLRIRRGKEVYTNTEKKGGRGESPEVKS
jgi:hypothetical protein